MRARIPAVGGLLLLAACSSAGATTHPDPTPSSAAPASSPAPAPTGCADASAVSYPDRLDTDCVAPTQGKARHVTIDGVAVSVGAVTRSGDRRSDCLPVGIAVGGHQAVVVGPQNFRIVDAHGAAPTAVLAPAHPFTSARVAPGGVHSGILCWQVAPVDVLLFSAGPFGSSRAVFSLDAQS